MPGLGHVNAAPAARTDPAGPPPGENPAPPDFAAGPLAPPRRRSIRTRLLLLALIPLGVVLPLMMAALAYWGGSYIDRLLTTKVRSDLAVADGYFERVRDGVGRSVSSLADSERLAGALRRSPPERFTAMAVVLEATQREQELDFLHFIDVDRAAQDARTWAVVAAALGGRASTETEVFTAPQLFAIGPSLAARALTPLVATANARPDSRSVESRGLVIHSAAPVRDADGRLLGVLEGGVLLNKNLDFIDRLNAIVYPEGTLPFGSAGTATLFLDDVRVATNVRLFGDTRAIGTRVSQAVYDTVLGKGQTWLDRAFVVNDWYVRPTSRCSTAASNASACSTSAFSRGRSAPPGNAPWPPWPAFSGWPWRWPGSSPCCGRAGCSGRSSACTPPCTPSSTARPRPGSAPCPAATSWASSPPTSTSCSTACRPRPVH